MSAELTAYATATHEAWVDVKSTGESLLREIKEGSITNDEELHEALMSYCEDRTTYTSSHWVLAWGLRDGDSFAECAEGIKGEDAEDTFSKTLAAKAFWNLFDATMERYGTDFQEAFSACASSARA